MRLKRLTLLLVMGLSLWVQAQPVTLVFVGDVMLGRGVAQALAGDWEAAFADIQEVFAGADLVVANLESPLTTAPYAGTGHDLRAPLGAVASLQAANVGAVSLANNHALDGGEAGLEETEAVLESAGIISLRHNSFSLHELRGTRIALVAYWDDPEVDLGLIRQAREYAQRVVVTVHWGAEYYGVTPRQRELASAFIQAGADLIIGHGPHILQPLVQEEGVWVAYSLGNFLFDSTHPPESRFGAALELQLTEAGFAPSRVMATVSKAGWVELDAAGTAYRFLGLTSWQAFSFDGEALQDAPAAAIAPVVQEDDARCQELPVPETWEVRRALAANVTDEHTNLCTLLLWRPWRDLPTSRWSSVASLTMRHQDARGDSAHIALIAPSSERGYREVWVASALPQPAIDLLAADLSGDGRLELMLLEGDYTTGREGPAQSLSVWRWNGFGFTLLARTQLESKRQLALVNQGEKVLVLVR